MSEAKDLDAAVVFPAPSLPPAHPLVALVVKATSPPGLAGPEWAAFDPSAMTPLRGVITELRSSARELYRAGHAWGSPELRSLLDDGLAEMAAAVCDYGYSVDGLARYLLAHRTSVPLRTKASDARFFDKMIRREQNRIDHKKSSYQRKGQ